MVGDMVLRAFLYPGNVVCKLIGARSDDDRALIRSMSNMLIWNLVVVLIVVLWW